MLGCCVPTFYLVADIFMVVMRGPFAVAVVAMCVRAVEGESGLELPRLQTTAPCWAGLGWAGWAGLPGLAGLAGLVRMWGHHQSCSLHTTRWYTTQLYRYMQGLYS